MPKFRIEHDRDACIGCGSCVSICPANWVMAKDGKSKPKKTDLDDIGCNQEAADACPVSCIKVVKI
jgi:ferredoxin